MNRNGERRLFNQAERDLLYQFAHGKCEMCGCELYGVFEADHIKPYSKGGKTDVINGQVLCEKCNNRKGDKEMGLGTWIGEDRKWQSDAFKHYLAKEAKDFTLVATPAAGKTYFCLKLAYALLRDGVVDQIVVVVPTDSLKKQWQADAHEVGLELTTTYDASHILPADYHGVVTTYHAVASRDGNAKKAYRILTSRKRTFVIFDEIHHAADGLSWGTSIQNAFECAHRRLSVTGTPFRSDTNYIPFVEYVPENGIPVLKADFTYSYADALRDGVVRPVYFPTYNGDLTWGVDEKLYTADFDTELSEVQSKRRLKTALAPKDVHWIDTFLGAAHEHLKQLREEDREIRAEQPAKKLPLSGGLVVAINIDHALALAEKLEKITGKSVTIVTSEMEDANDKIVHFAKSADEWIVAVKMISEGVSIPRLRICVYATNISTELFFRQVAGRILRVIAGMEGQSAYFYIPKDPTFAGYAEEFKQARAHILEEQRIAELLEEVDEDHKRISCGRSSNQVDFRAVGGDGQADVIIADGYVFTPQYMQACERRQEELGIRLESVLVAKLLWGTGFQQSVSNPSVSTPLREATIPLEEEKRELVRRRGKLNHAFGELIEASAAILSWQAIHRELNFAQQVKGQPECTLDQLKERLLIVKAWKEAYENGVGNEFSAKRYLRERAGGSFA